MKTHYKLLVILAFLNLLDLLLTLYLLTIPGFIELNPLFSTNILFLTFKVSWPFLIILVWVAKIKDNVTKLLDYLLKGVVLYYIVLNLNHFIQLLRAFLVRFKVAS